MIKDFKITKRFFTIYIVDGYNKGIFLFQSDDEKQIEKHFEKLGSTNTLFVGRTINNCVLSHCF